MAQHIRGEKVYECNLDLVKVTDYGVSIEAILTGKETIPPQGARFDLAVDGRAEGRLAGRQHGTDYLRIRADGRIDLDLHVAIETDTGHRIALAGDGVAVMHSGQPVIDLSANIRLTTAAKEYAWVNARQIWSAGTANLATGKIHVEAYMQ